MTDVRHRHHRVHDHFGQDLDLYVGIDEPLGPWEQYTPVKYVLEDLYARIAALETGARHLGFFSVNAYVFAAGGSLGTVPGNIRQGFHIDSVVKAKVTHTFTIYGYVHKGGTFTINAYIASASSFTINAFVV